MSSGGLGLLTIKIQKMTKESTNDNTPTTPVITHSECYAQVFSRLFFGDCLIESDKIESGSVDLILTDLPYGTVEGIGNNENIQHGMKGKTEWDSIIDTEKIMSIADRILRKNGKMILFAQQPFTTELINKAIPNLPFNYSMIWEKDHFANALTAKKAPLNYYEDILLFTKMNPKHDNTGENPVREYLVNEKKKSGMTNKDFNLLFSKYTNKEGCTDRSVIEHYWGRAQFTFPTQEIYENVLQPTGFFQKPYSYIEDLGKPYRLMINAQLNELNPATFNLWEGNKHKSNVFNYKKDYNGYHPTQKPVLLLEDLIKTFSNEDDLVVDLTAGSFSTAIACINTKRKFIGIEKDENYFNIGKERIKKHIEEQRINARTLFS
jgi:site-specific DNA-methyltransferase (adenine-specific)